MEIEQIITTIQTLGFPIFVCIWLLFRSDKKEEKTSEMLAELKSVIKELVLVIQSQNLNKNG